MGNVASNDHRPAQHHLGRDRELSKGRANLVHRPVEVDVDCGFVSEVRGANGRQEACRIGFELFEEEAVDRDFAEYLAVG